MNDTQREIKNVEILAENPARCPVDHSVLSYQKAVRHVEVSSPLLACDEHGVWHVRGFHEARAILRSSDTVQAGFGADFMEMVPGMTNMPILYLEGKEHNQQRKQTARFFAPKTVSTSYRQLMETLSDKLIGQLKEKRQADLSQLSLSLAVQVAGQVVGLTNSRLPGMAGRLETFFEQEPTKPQDTGKRKPGFFATVRQILNQRRMLFFYWLDVQPAIKARKRQLQEDVISHLVAQNRSDTEILTECVTYAAAGMVTTREFISMAAWHMLEHPDLRTCYLAAPEEERLEMLHETLRLEPIVGNLRRHAATELHIESQGREIVIPKGAVIDIHIYEANMDESVTGEEPFALCPGRVLQGERVPGMLMSFGDGHHRCPGAYIAIQETDIFLHRLLSLDGLEMKGAPQLTWNEFVTGYEIRNFQIALRA